MVQTVDIEAFPTSSAFNSLFRLIIFQVQFCVWSYSKPSGMVNSVNKKGYGFIYR